MHTISEQRLELDELDDLPIGRKPQPDFSSLRDRSRSGKRNWSLLSLYCIACVCLGFVIGYSWTRTDAAYSASSIIHWYYFLCKAEIPRRHIWPGFRAEYYVRRSPFSCV